MCVCSEKEGAGDNHASQTRSWLAHNVEKQKKNVGERRSAVVNPGEVIRQMKREKERRRETQFGKPRNNLPRKPHTHTKKAPFNER
jgi:hypothetical protein